MRADLDTLLIAVYCAACSLFPAPPEPKRRRGRPRTITDNELICLMVAQMLLVVSFLVWSVVVGFFLGSLTVTGLAAVLSESAMDSYGWRIPFLIAGILGGVGLYIRLRLDDTPEFEELRDPITSSRSTWSSISFTAHCRLDVA